ncbi:hypothetical protein B194_4591 [Serratia plymuthica A30]|nr:hypothetical protein B194_4591 [Serratia plymuthica A30]
MVTLIGHKSCQLGFVLINDFKFNGAVNYLTRELTLHDGFYCR